MKIRSSYLSTLLVGLISAVVTAALATSCQAQTAVLAEIYGRGVHAYNAGQYDQASQWLSMAIDNGFEDPRAYYFRGLTAAASGRGYEATGDFEQGAEIEARGTLGGGVGRALARVQGSTRLQLELIRENARLRALATSQSRSQARYGELGASGAGAAGAAPNRAAPGPARPRTVTPPGAPAAADPFADDLGQDPVVESNDVLKGAMENAIADDGAAGAADAGDAAGGASPFDGGGGNDPFAAPPGGGGDPFAPAGGAGADDPFSF